MNIGCKIFENEADVISTLKQYILLGSERSNFVSPIYDFYKIQFDGEEIIENLYSHSQITSNGQGVLTIKIPPKDVGCVLIKNNQIKNKNTYRLR